jgi:putative tryptophan/tyrosine transport system permease protein
MSSLLAAITLGLILSLLALGVYISFRLFSVPDITVDGSITLGASVTAVLLLQSGHPLLANPLVATSAGMIAGAVAGLATGVLQTKCRIDPLISGIIVMTALYSINLRIMGKSNVSIPSTIGLGAWAETLGVHAWGPTVRLLGWEVDTSDVVICAGSAILVAVVSLLLYLFFRTNIGTALRASGDNPQMVLAMGVSVERCRIFGLALSNGLVGLSGALFCQYLKFADAQMGIGMIVFGLASVIIGEALTGTRSLGFALIGTIMGSVLFRLLVSIALRLGFEATDLKLITAVCLFIALVMPILLRKMKRVRPAASN